MKTPGTEDRPRSIAGFRRWLRAEIAELADDWPDENQFREAGASIREARRIALALDRPDVAKICYIRTGAVALAVVGERVASRLPLHRSARSFSRSVSSRSVRSRFCPRDAAIWSQVRS